jgi:hypothetical protein
LETFHHLINLSFLLRSKIARFSGLLLFSGIGFLVMGYHPGSEDDGVYLSAIKSDMNPALFPHDAAFFRLQMRASIFDTWMAQFAHGTGMPIAWAELLWQGISILLMIWACWSILRQLFPEASARWAGVAMAAAMFTLPVAGTALYIFDQHLHPRGPATALALFAVSRILAGKRWQALPFNALAFVLHPLMGALGISFCCFLSLTLFEPLQLRLRTWRARFVPQAVAPVAAFVPFGWVFDPPSQIWLDALHSRHWYSLYQWTWYEWLGAVGPLALFGIVARVARSRGEVTLSRFATAIVIYGVFQQAVAMIIFGSPSMIGLATLEPMRYLHLVYIFMAIVGGAYLGRHLLGARVWRWAVFLLVANGGMFIAQRQLFAGTVHLELPSSGYRNPWLQAFAWIKHNTPENAYFALDPNYMASPGEDFHSFRALAERSQLADAIKDTSVVTKVPELGPEWKREVDAQAGWQHFRMPDFKRLKANFGVDWVLVSYPQPAGLACHWHNNSLSVCQVP